jgi:hypothetical protein
MASGDEVRNRVDPQIAAPDVEQGEYGASETGNDHMAPAPNPRVLEAKTVQEMMPAMLKLPVSF